MNLCTKILQPWIVVAVFLSFVSKGVGQTIVLEFSGNKVWIKNLDEEVLHTFCRYYNKQEDWREVFPVTTAESDGEITIDGTYEVSGSTISFAPRFPFSPGVRYHAEFHTEALVNNYNEIYLPMVDPATLHLRFSVSPPMVIEPAVAAIYPSGDILPENLLKFHVYFNSSMTRGEVYDRITLKDRKGNRIEKAFLVMDQEFWDDDMKVVTVLFDPGRIKRGLRPNLEMGPALKAGEVYTLTINAGWKNIGGQKTKHIYEKHFTCVAADRESPKVESWIVVPPASAQDPLTVHFNEGLDRILLSDALRIIDSNGNAVKGEIVCNNDSSLQFLPLAPWKKSQYVVSVNPLLEDLAGNNLNRVFDEDVSSEVRQDKADASFTFFFPSAIPETNSGTVSRK